MATSASPTPDHDFSHAALGGLRVLDLSRVIAGPWSAQVLVDLGADVIKVERPRVGDDSRAWAPPYMRDRDGRNVEQAVQFAACNRGKRSIELDFETEDGQRIVRKLAAKSDILIENFKVGGLAKFKLDYKSMSQDFPRLIYCSVTGFGQDGPYAPRAGYDLMAQGMGGLMDITGMADGPPTKVGGAVSDIFTGVYSVVGILAALAQRERTGKGAYVDTALVDSTVGILANQALNFLVSGNLPVRLGNSHANIVPYQEFPTADGHIIIATGNDGQYIKLCHILGAPELATDPTYKDNVGRLTHRNVLVPKLAELTRKMKRDDLLAKLEEQKVPAGPINNIEQVFNDPQVIARGMKLDLKSDAAKGGSIPGVRTPIVIDGWRAASERPSPRLGEHTAEILKEIGEG